MTEVRELLTISELSARLKVSEGTIYYWVSRNEIPYLKIGRHLRFDLAKIIEYFRDRTPGADGPCVDGLGAVSSGLRSLKTRIAGHSIPRVKGEMDGNN